ncbi:unnamed protein product [Amoebophrya sp. A120]|nr:unnamed protein product [Amoebophrya sp. A120]|eukprot:GSA120T00000481001.1
MLSLNRFRLAMSVFLVVLSVFGTVSTAASPRSRSGDFFDLHFIDGAQYPLARCLDGSLPYFYISRPAVDEKSLAPAASAGAAPARPVADTTTDKKRNFIFYLEGGAWCESVEDCVARSETYLGSGKFLPEKHENVFFPARTSGIIPYLDSDCEEVNPEFCEFTKVIIHYCDGNSFTGQRKDVVEIAEDGEDAGEVMMTSKLSSTSADVKRKTTKVLVDQHKLASARAIYKNLQQEYRGYAKALGGLVKLNPSVDGESDVIGEAEQTQNRERKGKIKLYFRGRYILDAVIESVLTTLSAPPSAPKGMSSEVVLPPVQPPNSTTNANIGSVLLAGCSAGGLAVLLHADRVKEKFFNNLEIKFRAASFSGWFMDVQTVFPKQLEDPDSSENKNKPPTTPLVQKQATAAVLLHDSFLPGNCVEAQRRKGRDPNRCIFAAIAYPETESTIFVQNSAVDAYQIEDILTQTDTLFGVSSPTTETKTTTSVFTSWALCTKDLEYCDAAKMTVLREFETALVKSVVHAFGLKEKRLKNRDKADKSTTFIFSDVFFLDSCLRHCESETLPLWMNVKLGAEQEHQMQDDSSSTPSVQQNKNTANYYFSLQQSMSNWWRGQGVGTFETIGTTTFSVSQNSQYPFHVLPCLVSNTTRPRQCDRQCYDGVSTGNGREIFSDDAPQVLDVLRWLFFGGHDFFWG